MALYLDVGPGDLVRIGDLTLTVERKSGQRARLRFVGPNEVELIKGGRDIEEAAQDDNDGRA